MVGLALALAAAAAAAAPKPHIILYVVDDQGWANVGYHNPGNVITPNIDTLAAEGVRLERHYVYRWCAPTRSALLSGRLPYHVLQTTNHVDRAMTLLPAKLKTQGYATHQVGKWHLGCTHPWMTPHGRGFDTSLGYLTGGEDHYTQTVQAKNGLFGCGGVDLYKTDAPAYGQNGTYGAYIYNAEIQRVIAAHDPSVPLFMYIATQVMHAPQEVPEFYSAKYPSPKYSEDYAIMQGMATVCDEILGNTTAALNQKGMWPNTLLVYTSDNGGPAGQASSGHSGNNWPLRGGKTNLFEGGVRVNAFVSGGWLPDKVRGTKLDGYVHGCDWYPTLTTLVGADPADDHDGIPGVDGMDMWPYITGAVSSSPRTEMMISSEPLKDAETKKESWNGALISGDYKLIIGVQSYAFWTGPNYPNATTDHKHEAEYDCGHNGCLFNIRTDPEEYHDLATIDRPKHKELRDRFSELNKTRYEAVKTPSDEKACKAYVKAHGGFVGPYMN